MESFNHICQSSTTKRWCCFDPCPEDRTQNIYIIGGQALFYEVKGAGLIASVFSGNEFRELWALLSEVIPIAIMTTAISK